MRYVRTLILAALLAFGAVTLAEASGPIFAPSGIH